METLPGSPEGEKGQMERARGTEERYLQMGRGGVLSQYPPAVLVLRPLYPVVDAVRSGDEMLGSDSLGCLSVHCKGRRAETWNAHRQ